MATDLALGKIKLLLSALDFVAQEFEAIPDMNDPRLLADVIPHPVVSGFGEPRPQRLLPPRPTCS